jgi:macrolide-specific efflux system membrane fusion protein
MRFKWIVFVVGLVALSSFAFYGLFDRSDEVSHIVAPVTKIDMESLVLATGPIVATGLVDVGAQVNGQVKTIHVRLGDKVKKRPGISGD